MLLREVLEAHANLATVRANAESGGTYTALVIERLLAAGWPKIEVFTTMVAIAMPPSQFPRSNGAEGETAVDIRGGRFSVIHYMKDKLSNIPEAHTFGLSNFLWERYFKAFIITNDQQCDDRVFGAKGHLYGPFTKDIIGAGTGKHELLNLATSRGLSNSRDKLDWIVQFLTLHLHRMNCAWGFLHDLATKWEAHPKLVQNWKLDSGDVGEIFEATNKGVEMEGNCLKKC